MSAAVLSFTKTRNSLDEFVCDVQAMGMGVTVCQLDAALVASRLQLCASASTRVGRFDVGNRMHHLMEVDTACYNFGLLAGEQPSVRVRASEFSSREMMLFDPEVGHDAVVEGGFSGFVVSIRKERIEKVADSLQISGVEQLAKSEGLLREIPTRLAALICVQLDSALAQAEKDWGKQQLEYFLESALPALILDSWYLNGRASQGAGSLSSRGRVCGRAVDFIRDNSSEIYTVEQLCRASASSYSTLERAFRERFGISPKRYLLQNRMSGIRQALLKEEEGRTITQLAHEWGFTHMGKFAAGYRRFYGELPSQTGRICRD